MSKFGSGVRAEKTRKIRLTFASSGRTRRLVRGRIERECLAVRLVPLSTWGSELKAETYGSATVHIFAFEPTA